MRIQWTLDGLGGLGQLLIDMCGLHEGNRVTFSSSIC